MVDMMWTPDDNVGGSSFCWSRTVKRYRYKFGSVHRTFPEQDVFRREKTATGASLEFPGKQRKRPWPWVPIWKKGELTWKKRFKKDIGWTQTFEVSEEYARPSLILSEIATPTGRERARHVVVPVTHLPNTKGIPPFAVAIPDGVHGGIESGYALCACPFGLSQQCLGEYEDSLPTDAVRAVLSEFRRFIRADDEEWESEYRRGVVLLVEMNDSGDLVLMVSMTPEQLRANRVVALRILDDSYPTDSRDSRLFRLDSKQDLTDIVPEATEILPDKLSVSLVSFRSFAKHRIKRLPSGGCAVARVNAQRMAELTHKLDALLGSDASGPSQHNHALSSVNARLDAVEVADTEAMVECYYEAISGKTVSGAASMKQSSRNSTPTTQETSLEDASTSEKVESALTAAALLELLNAIVAMLVRSYARMSLPMKTLVAIAAIVGSTAAIGALVRGCAEIRVEAGGSRRSVPRKDATSPSRKRTKGPAVKTPAHVSDRAPAIEPASPGTSTDTGLARSPNTKSASNDGYFSKPLGRPRAFLVELHLRDIPPWTSATDARLGASQGPSCPSIRLTTGDLLSSRYGEFCVYRPSRHFTHDAWPLGALVLRRTECAGANYYGVRIYDAKARRRVSVAAIVSPTKGGTESEWTDFIRRIHNLKALLLDDRDGRSGLSLAAWERDFFDSQDEVGSDAALACIYETLLEGWTVDTDVDGLPDGLERSLKTSPYAADSDRDGNSDLDELVAAIE